MPRRKTRTFTEVELEFMQVLWAEGEASTEDVQEALRRRGRALADGSVRKVLAILIAKGYATRRREGRAHLYHATVPQHEARHSLVADLLGRAFGGSASLLVASLLDGRDVRDDDIEAIKKLIAEREREDEP